MKLNKVILLTILILLFLTGCNKKNGFNDEVKENDENIYEHDDHVEDNMEDYKENCKEDIREEDEIVQEKNVQDKIQEKIKSMTLEEKAGQLIIAGFNGVEISDYTIDLINKYKIGGFILFSRNIKDKEQAINLLNDLKVKNLNNDIPLFLSIDEEGGKVSRLPREYVKIPEAIKFGEKGNIETSYTLGEILGKRVRILGFNIDFAPVLDIYSNPKNKVIGKRAYGTTTESVVSNGIEVMKGIRSTGVISVVKHFPGHGDTSLDSHIKLPRINKTLEELETSSLIPFENAIKEEVEMIMIAHILYPEIDSFYPASLSTNIIEKLLREKMKYNGVVISDDMTMGAIVKNYSLEDAVVQFLKAGGDVALICHGERKSVLAINKIIDAVNDGEISENEIDKKVNRILNLKIKYNLEDKIIESIDLEELNKETNMLIEKISN